MGKTRLRLAVAAAAFALVAVLAFALIASSPRELTEQPSATSTAEPTSVVLGATATPSRPAATPEGTPAPRPETPVETSASVEVSPPPSLPRPTPTLQPGLWRVQGYVVDESGRPLANVCVVVGPHGCKVFSPHTDQRGHYFLDVAERKAGEPMTSFDFYFEMPGRETVWWHFAPTGPTEFNVVLRRSYSH